MKKLFPTMYNLPDRTLSIAGLIYGIFCFYTFPFLALFFSGGYTEPGSQTWFEIIYHGVNFIFILWLFRKYLKESFFDVQCDPAHFIKTVLICASLMLSYSIIFTAAAILLGTEKAFFAAEGTLPIAEMELFTLSSYRVSLNPVFGTVSVVFLAPVTVSCVYYASTFAPFCENRPWLAYLMMAVILTVPRILNSLTFWPWDQNLLLYLVQLPLHMIACYAYEKTNTIWAPIATLAIANAVSSLFYIFIF